MKPTQWMFHFLEIKKREAEERNRTVEAANAIISAISNMSEMIIKNAWISSTMSHPNVNLTKANDEIQKMFTNGSQEKIIEEMTESFNQLMKILPRTVEITVERKKEVRLSKKKKGRVN